MQEQHYLALYLGERKRNKSSQWLDWLICWATDSPYSHVEYVTHYEPEQQMAVCWGSSPRDGGVRRQVIQLKEGHWELYELKDHASSESVYDFFEPLIGSKYDWIGAIATKFRLFCENPHRYFCSEIIAQLRHIPYPSTYTPAALKKALHLSLCQVDLKSASRL